MSWRLVARAAQNTDLDDGRSRRHRHRFAMMGAATLLLSCVTGCGGGIPRDAVVRVGDRTVLKTTFQHWLAVAASSTAQTSSSNATRATPVVPEPPYYTACVAHLYTIDAKPAKGGSKPNTGQLRSECEQQYKMLQQQVLAFLISSYWVLGEAEAQGVKANKQEVQRQFQDIKTQQFPKPEAFKHYLESSGLTIGDLLLRVRVNLLSSKIQHKIVAKATLSDRQIRKYYSENEARFAIPEKRTILAIVTRTQAAALRAKRAVESGEAFAAVARRDSIDGATKRTGGELSGLVNGDGEVELDKPVFAAKIGVIEGPVKTPAGQVVFEVKSVTPPTHGTLAQTRSAIRQQLMAAEQQTALSHFRKELRQKWIAKTECRAGYVISDCEEYRL
jgi:foldase protein PrsA